MGENAVATAWDIDALLLAWIENTQALGWDVLNEPTPSRGRTLRDLSVNVFRPIELLPQAWRCGRFVWIASEDDQRVAELDALAGVLAYLASVEAGWKHFLIDEEPALGAGDRTVGTEKGDLKYRSLIDAQRLHASYHLRQQMAFLEQRGLSPASAFRPEHALGLKLPRAIF